MMLLRQFIPQEAFVSSLVRKVNLSSVNDKNGSLFETSHVAKDVLDVL